MLDCFFLTHGPGELPLNQKHDILVHIAGQRIETLWERDTLVYIEIVHNCTIFLCSLDVRNIVQGGDPLYAGFFSTQGSGGYT